MEMGKLDKGKTKKKESPKTKESIPSNVESEKPKNSGSGAQGRVSPQADLNAVWEDGATNVPDDPNRIQVASD